MLRAKEKNTAVLTESLRKLGVDVKTYKQQKTALNGLAIVARKVAREELSKLRGKINAERLALEKQHCKTNKEIQKMLDDLDESLEAHRTLALQKTDMDLLVIKDAATLNQKQNQLLNFKQMLIDIIAGIATECYEQLISDPYKIFTTPQTTVNDNDNVDSDLEELFKQIELQNEEVNRKLSLLAEKPITIPTKMRDAFNHIFTGIAQIDNSNNLCLLDIDPKSSIKDISKLITNARNLAYWQYNSRVYYLSYYPFFIEIIQKTIKELAPDQAVYWSSDIEKEALTKNAYDVEEEIVSQCRQLTQHHKKYFFELIKTEKVSLEKLAEEVQKQLGKIKLLATDLETYRQQKTLVTTIIAMLVTLWKQCYRSSMPADERPSYLPSRASMLHMMRVLVDNLDHHTPALGLQIVKEFSERAKGKKFYGLFTGINTAQPTQLQIQSLKQGFAAFQQAPENWHPPQPK